MIQRDVLDEANKEVGVIYLADVKSNQIQRTSQRTRRYKGGGACRLSSTATSGACAFRLLMFGFVDQSVADAAGTGDLKAVQDYLDANPHQLDNRTLFQSNLLHIAARNGQTAIAEELLWRGIDLDALDYGGMRRTALHWACQGGHVRIVELLVDYGANTEIWCSHDMLQQQQQLQQHLQQQEHQQHQVQGKAWSMLVQGKRCGRLIDRDAPFEDSPSSLCSSYSVRLALERPEWTPQTHHMFPPRFKEMVRLLLLFQHCARRTPLETSGIAAEPDQATEGAEADHVLRGKQACAGMCRQLDWDCLREILALSAYPISSWL
ncbi:g10657 [Coccomyxa elongata]